MTIKIGIYSSPFSANLKPTGVGQHIVRMSEGLASFQGVEPSLIATRKAYLAARPMLSERLANMRVNYLPFSDKVMRWLLIGGGLAVDRWAKDIDWVYCPKEQPILTQRCKLVVTVHDVLAFEPSIPGLSKRRASSIVRWKLLMHRILKRASIIATVSEFTRRRLLELFSVKQEERIVVIGNGVAPLYFSNDTEGDQGVLQSYGLLPQNYIVTVGSLTYRKGGDRLIELARLLKRRRISQEIVVTGRRHDADLLAKYESIKRDSSDLPIRLIGFVSDEDQVALLRNSTALLFPSRYEGFGIPVVEAMATGAPVLCTRAAALPEIVGNAAMFLEADNTEQWVEAISAVSDPQVRRELVNLGRIRSQEFKWDGCIQRLIGAMTR